MQPTLEGLSSMLGASGVPHIPTQASNPLDSSGSRQSHNLSESDTDPPRLSAAEKGKQRVGPRALTPEDEPDYGGRRTSRESVTPTPYTATGVMSFSDRWKFNF